MNTQSQRGDASYLEIDTWETLRETVMERDPSLGAELEAAGKRDWTAIQPRDRAAIALATMLDLDPHTPATRRHVRAMLKDFERDSLIPPPPSEAVYTREEPLPAYQDMKVDQRREMAPVLEWILSGDFERQLAAASGPIAAVALMESQAKPLKGHRSARFLRDIGYPVAVPDKSRRRWMHRFGIIGELKESRKNRDEALRQLLEISNRTGAALAELDLVLGAFTGAQGSAKSPSAICVQKPQCLSCPLLKLCQYAKFVRQHGRLEEAAEKRNLATAFLPEDRPREKLSIHGAQSLTNAELLAILLRTGSGREHAVELANRILREAGSLERLSHASIAEMTRIPGLGPVKAITIKAALELARRVAQTPGEAMPAVSGARAVFDYLRGYMLDKRKEVFICLLLNTKNRIMRRVVVSEGTLNQSLVHPREAFQEALKDSAAAVIFAHNHPSGDPKPSRDDTAITQRLVKAGDIVGVKVLDHVIVGRETYYSFADEGEL